MGERKASTQYWQEILDDADSEVMYLENEER